MAIVTGDRYLEKLVRFVEENAGPLIDGTLVLKLNPVGLHYVQSRLEALSELESLLAGAPIDYLRAYVSDLGDHRALEQLRRILRLLTSLKVVSVLAPPARDPTPLSLLPFGRLRLLELRGCDLSTSAAKGLLELRHTLERIVCHNSTDALRHVFASRIAEIKDSPQWNRLSFVSCACNGMLLMDESLQLLPAVETLDLSRNKFTKVDNLRKCAKLKHLDLGFNHLRTVTSFSEVSCHIAKLVLRNNALTTLHGIENLKSLEDLDVSYNIISNFSELEFLVGLPSLQSLWLEGNPLCCARWYRPQAFSYINHLENFKLDDKEISTREFWKRQLIISSRQKRPASFGFYSPAICDDTGEGSNNRRRKKVTRLASIEGEGENTYLCSDQDSVSIDNEVQSREEIVMSDDDAEIVDLMNKVELMKKERSVLWLREFKEWMDHAHENVMDHNKYIGTTLYPGRENLSKTWVSERNVSESLRYVSDSVQASGDESSTNVMESDSSLHSHQYIDQIGLMGVTGGANPSGSGRTDLKEEHVKSSPYERSSSLPAQTKSLLADTFANQLSFRSISPLIAIDSISESHSSAQPGSPPHYREDILHRRQYLEEEILQLSAESYSVASSDSNTSCSDDDICAFGPMSDIDQLLNEKCSNAIVERHPGLKPFEDEYYERRHRISPVRENGQCSADPSSNKTSDMQNSIDSDRQTCGNDGPEAHDCKITHVLNEEDDLPNKRKGKRKTKRRVVSLVEEKNAVGKIVTPQKSNGDFDLHGTEAEIEQHSRSFDRSDLQEVDEKKQIIPSIVITQRNEDAHRSPSVNWSCREIDDFIEDHFNSNVADSRNHEICVQYMRCHCILEMDSMSTERDVALVLSSEKKLYVLLIGATDDGSETISSFLACHRIEDVREVLVGMGLQVVRLSIERSAYLFITRSIGKSRQLLCILEVLYSYKADDISLRSLEQVQVDLFEKQILGGSKVSIFQYALVLFWHNNHEEDSWLPRSLFVVGVHLLVCVEDLVKFSSLLVDTSSSLYFSFDSCCSITDISEMVVETKKSQCVTLAFSCATPVCHSSAKSGKEGEGMDKEKKTLGSPTWKLKWFSEDCLFKFVALLKAIHAGTGMSPLSVRCI
ncbi:uncharacterized protein LOC21392153 isoform X1 [Morus notabilis]|uniref:uncharacterized protein LOC21392153 isoform X1 n=1 Tax=Morus notabilis TaxID=981085 RepID=UPI000CECE43C|nr:uncharacterized protein LOC21392153 isoform X1 [Morus notabilis]